MWCPSPPLKTLPRHIWSQYDFQNGGQADGVWTGRSHMELSLVSFFSYCNLSGMNGRVILAEDHTCPQLPTYVASLSCLKSDGEYWSVIVFSFFQVVYQCYAFRIANNRSHHAVYLNFFSGRLDWFHYLLWILDSVLKWGTEALSTLEILRVRLNKMYIM